MFPTLITSAFIRLLLQAYLQKDILARYSNIVMHFVALPKLIRLHQRCASICHFSPPSLEKLVFQLLE